MYREITIAIHFLLVIMARWTRKIFHQELIIEQRKIIDVLLARIDKIVFFQSNNLLLIFVRLSEERKMIIHERGFIFTER